MKNLLPQTLLALAAIGTLALVAVGADQEQGAGTPEAAAGGAANSVKAAPTQMQDGIVKMEGQHWLVKSGQRTKVGKDTTLPSGVKIAENGEITLNGGKAVTLQDGQFVTSQGQVMAAPDALKESEEAIAASNAAAGTPSAQANANAGSQENRETTDSPGTNTSNSGKAIQGRSATEVGDK